MSVLKKARACSVLLVLSTANGSVQADSHEDAMAEYSAAIKLTPDFENGKKIYKTCSVCHGPEGWGHESGS